MEESSFKTSNVPSILGDVSGVQYQQTSAVSGNSVVRMQGLDGRYTVSLRDGMPAYTGLFGGLDIRMPPFKLKQVDLFLFFCVFMCMYLVRLRIVRGVGRLPDAVLDCLDRVIESLRDAVSHRLFGDATATVADTARRFSTSGRSPAPGWLTSTSPAMASEAASSIPSVTCSARETTVPSPMPG